MENFNISFVKSFSTSADFVKWGLSVKEWGYTKEKLAKVWGDLNPKSVTESVTTTPTPEVKPAQN